MRIKQLAFRRALLLTVLLAGYAGLSGCSDETVKSENTPPNDPVAAVAQTPGQALPCPGHQAQTSPKLKVLPNRGGVITLDAGHMLIIPDDAFQSATDVWFEVAVDSLKFNIHSETKAATNAKFTIVAVLKGCGDYDKTLAAYLDTGKLEGASGEADKKMLNLSVVSHVLGGSVIKARDAAVESGWVTIGE